MKRLGLLLSLALLTVPLAGCVISGPRGGAPRLTAPLPPGVNVTSRAGAFWELARAVKPTFTIVHEDFAPRLLFMWARDEDPARPAFDIREPFVLKDTDGRQYWALADGSPARSGAPGGDPDLLINRRCPFFDRLPAHDTGPGDYVVEIARHETHGTLYRVGYATGPRGSGAHATHSAFFFLRTPAGAWRFVASGPVDKSGRNGAETYRSGSDYTITWTEDIANPVMVEAKPQASDQP